MKLRTQIVLIVVFPLFAMLAIASIGLSAAFGKISEAENVTATVNRAIPLGDLVHELQVERGMSAGFIASKGKNFADDLPKQRHVLDARLLAAMDVLSDRALVSDEDAKKIENAVDSALELRERISALDITVPEMARNYTGAIRATLEMQSKKLSSIALPRLGKVGAGWVALSEAKEAAGLERAMGATGLGAGQFATPVLKRFWELGAVQRGQLANAEIFAQSVLGDVDFQSFTEFQDVNSVRTAVLDANGDSSQIATTAPEWFGISTRWIESLRAVELRLGAATNDVAILEREAARNHAWLYAGLTGLAAFGSLVALFFITRAFTRRSSSLIDAMQNIAKKRFDVEVPCLKEQSEMGDLARSLSAMRTDLRDADAKLVEAFSKSFAFGDSDAAMLITDPDLNIVSYNASSTQLFEQHFSDFKQIWSDFDPNETEGRSIVGLTGAIDDMTSLFGNKDALPWRSDVNVGDLKLEVNVSYVEAEDGSYAGNVIQMRDVTEERLHGGMIAAIERDQCIAELTLDGTFLRVNRIFAEAIGVEGNDLKGQTLAEYLCGDDEVTQDFPETWANVQSGRSETPRLKLTNAKGETVWMRTVLNPVEDSTGTVFRITMIGEDITFGVERHSKEMAEKAKSEADRNMIVDSLAQALERVSSGDLSQKIDTPFAEEFDALRLNFNNTVDRLSTLMARVTGSVEKLRGSSSELSEASGNLASRTEDQAATLEETASALEEITATIKSTATKAEDTDKVVTEARKGAEEGSRTVSEAVIAMEHIAQSSKEMSSIISVIEDISFQTNLLSLNAGVEAARAGEAGRGFSVVAYEVRALAQRAADSAQEISALIEKSETHVKEGVALVDAAGKALETIASTVVSASEHVGGIRLATTEQSAAISELNNSVSIMDGATQQNAAMVEEATALSLSLKHDADALSETVADFKTNGQPTEELQPSSAA